MIIDNTKSIQRPLRLVLTKVETTKSGNLLSALVHLRAVRVEKDELFAGTRLHDFIDTGVVRALSFKRIAGSSNSTLKSPIKNTGLLQLSRSEKIWVQSLKLLAGLRYTILKIVS